MRWKEEVELRPYHGQLKQYEKFAWLPIRDEEGNCAWLEKVTVIEEFRIDPNYHWVIKEIK